MKMGCVVREPLHCLAAQPRETAIFEGEHSDLTTVMHTHHVRRVPIVDEQDKVIELVMLDDLLVLLSHEMVDMHETVSSALFRPPIPIEHIEAIPLDCITSHL